MKNANFYSLFEFSPVAMWVYDELTLQFLDVNLAAVQHYGYTKEQFLQMNINQLTYSDRANDAGRKDTLNKTGKILHRHRRIDGTLIYVELESNPITYNERKARIVLANEVTDKMEAQQALILSEQRFKALVQDASDVITIVDKDFICSYVGSASLRSFGSTIQFAVGNYAFEHIHEDDVERVLLEAAAIWENKQIMFSPYRYQDLAGNWVWIETKATNLLDDPAVEGIVCISKNITQRIEEEQWSRLLENVVTQSDDGVLITDASATPGPYIVYVNDTLVRMSGFTREELIGSSPAILHLRQEQQPAIVQLYSTVEMGRECRIDMVNHTKQGKKYDVNVTVCPVLNEKGQISNWISIRRDITAQKKYVAAIEAQNKSLREIRWMQSHGVRAPLARIMSLVSLLGYSNDESTQIEMLNHLEQSAKELDIIVTQIANETPKLVDGFLG